MKKKIVKKHNGYYGWKYCLEGKDIFYIVFTLLLASFVVFQILRVI